MSRRGTLTASALLALVTTATPTAWARGDGDAITVARVDTDMPVVALTFDACPTKAGTKGFDPEIVEILRRERVPATIFVSGRWIERHWDEARALADEPLFELGNHSYRHPPFSRLPAAPVRE